MKKFKTILQIYFVSKKFISILYQTFNINFFVFINPRALQMGLLVVLQGDQNQYKLNNQLYLIGGTKEKLL